MDDDDLAKNFKQYRQKYWIKHGLFMPDRCVCVFRQIRGDKHRVGQYDRLFALDKITISPYYKHTYWATKIILLHEMAHYYLGWNYRGMAARGHGKLFKSEIDRLYALGAFRDLI